MYYVNLPWYAQVIWIIGVAIVLLPVVASIAIVIRLIAQRFLGVHKEAAGLELGGGLASSHLGVTMADGGDRIDSEPKTSKK